MHRATGQLGQLGTADEDLKWPMENGPAGKQLAENWPRQIVNSLGQCFREVWHLQPMSQLGA